MFANSSGHRAHAALIERKEFGTHAAASVPRKLARQSERRRDFFHAYSKSIRFSSQPARGSFAARS
jgi:hypothetical protein